MDTNAKLKRYTTFGIIICTFLHGLCYYSFNITIIDFKEIINKPLNDVSVGQTVRNLAACIGSILVGSVLSNIGNTQIIYSMFVAFEGIVAAILPFVPNLILYDVINAFIGLSCGIIETISFVNIVNLWQEKSDPFIQAIGLAVNVAMVVSPLTFNPFLSNVESEEHGLVCGQLDLSVTANATKSDLPFGELHKSQIWMPHVVIGILMAVIAYCCVILECRRIKHGREDNVDKRKQETLSLKGGEEEESKESESKCYRITFILLSCLLIAIFWGYVCSYLQFWVTFVMFSKLNISKSKAVMMMTAISLSMAIGGFVGLLASIRIRPMRMLAMLNVFLVVADSILLLAVDRSEVLLWIGGVMCSFVFGNYYVSVYNLLQERVGITNLIGSMFTVSAYLLTAFGLPVLLANYIECTPIVFLYYTSSSITVSILLFLTLYFISCGKKERSVEINIEQSEVKETPKKIYRRKYSSRRMSVAGVAL